MRWFTNNAVESLSVDMHSHLIPGIDDGAKDLDHSIKMIRLLQDIGFKKLITTPHIHPKYPNSESVILEGLEKVLSNIPKNNIGDIDIEAAAEYYVDDQFMTRLKEGKKFLSFGDGFILIECSFSVKPYFFESVVYGLKEKGYKPILAHPERYRFLEGEIDWLLELRSTGLLFQITLGSIGGMYGEEVKRIGLELIKNKLVDFLASDLHRSSQMDFLKKGLEHREVQKLLKTKTLFNEQLH